jgi:flagellar basal-body rod modification protein FlgD
MNIKRSTQSFSKAEQANGFRSDGAQASSASDMQKALGEQNVGDVLNKLADPNWVDPSKKIRTTGDPSLSKDAFMKLMLTQMKHQDPSNPMQSHEMAAQLAQFSSLEQLSNINGTLEMMKTQSAPQTNYQALALIGKHVSGDSSKLTRASGDTKHGASFDLLGDAANVKVSVRDSGGNIVRKLELGAMKKGRNSIEWNGLKDDGLAARPGEYKIAVEGVNNTGGKIYAKTDFGGRITGLNFTNEGPVLMVGNQTIKLSDVKKIEDNVPEQASAKTPATPLNVMAPPQKADQKNHRTDDNLPPAEEETNQGNISSIPMSRELMTKLEKQTS